MEPVAVSRKIFGQDGYMPRFIQTDLPSEVEMAVTVIGNRAHAVILRLLATHGPCVIGTLLEGVQMSRPSLNKHLVSLENAGLVVGNPPPGERHGKIVTYQVDLHTLRHLTAEYLRYTSGK